MYLEPGFSQSDSLMSNNLRSWKLSQMLICFVVFVAVLERCLKLYVGDFSSKVSISILILMYL